VEPDQGKENYREVIREGFSVSRGLSLSRSSLSLTLSQLFFLLALSNIIFVVDPDPAVLSFFGADKDWYYKIR
jgi:hypothetical protein